MKQGYERYETKWRMFKRDRPTWCYTLKRGYGSRGRTAQHCRQFVWDVHDIRYEHFDFKVRRRRSDHHLNRCVLEPRVSRDWKRSWKDFTKNRHQWMPK